MAELTNYKISEHCKKRYAERLLNKDDNHDINKFIVDNEDKIKTDVNKLLTYGDIIFQGKQSQKDGKGKVLDVYLKDVWVVLVDSSSNTVVTLYRIDLGCGDEFNLQYISKMMDKLNQNKENLIAIQLEIEEESKTYKELMDSAQAQINEYKGFIKNLEQLCSSYQSIIDNNCVKKSQAYREVAEVVNTLVNKREF